jgi:hypothetical protein
MVEVIQATDMEAFVVSFLKTHTSMPVGTRVPNLMRECFVRVSQTGGTRRDVITDTAAVLVECFAPDTVSASNIAGVCRAYLLSAAALTDEVTRIVDGGGPVFLPDPLTNTPRYQFLIELHMRGSVLIDTSTRERNPDA